MSHARSHGVARAHTWTSTETSSRWRNDRVRVVSPASTWRAAAGQSSCWKAIVDAFRCENFADALIVDANVIAVDIPIGIPAEGARPADTEARRFVGPRSSSVFTTPIRPVLQAPTYAEARRVATELTGRSVSAQTYGIARRILEVDEYAQQDKRVIEVHPEVSFREFAKRPLESKHRTQGLAERRALLVEAGIELPASVPRVAEPDLLDATAAAWSARRYARGEAVPLPEGHRERIGAIWR